MKQQNQRRPRVFSASYSAFILIVLLILAFSTCSFAQEKLAGEAQYHRYIDALLHVEKFGTAYYEDGAADASVLFPESTQSPYGFLRPADPVIALVRLKQASFPLLIDCLSDGRLTRMRFGGNRTTSPMNVPVGYVCLDLLMGIVRGKPVSDPDCSDDGLGACMNFGFYFRPDDYYDCSDTSCMARPWVLLVKRNWKTQFLAHTLKFHNPYDALPVDEYRDLRTPSK